MKLDDWHSIANLALETPVSVVAKVLAAASDEELASVVAKFEEGRGVRALVATPRGLWDFRFPDALSPEATAVLYDWTVVGPPEFEVRVDETFDRGKVDQSSTLRLPTPEFTIDWRKREPPEPILAFVSVLNERRRP